MRRIARGLVLWFTTIAVVVGLGTLPGPSQASVSPTEAAPERAAAAAAGAPDNYSPPPGLRFNEPYGRKSTSPVRIRRHILRSIDSTVRRDQIKIAAWNIRGRNYTDALIRAHRRGVSVQVIIDKSNWTAEHPNPEAAQLSRALRGTENRPNQSWLKPCRSSCRGTRGIPHSKFFLFDHVRKRRYVTMYGSNNATDVAANDQWNDLYTFVNNESMYDSFKYVFNQMKKDRNVGGAGFRRVKFGDNMIDFYPYKGALPREMGDPDMRRLNRIRCKGATGGAGFNGRTKIRIAQTAIHGERGIRLAQKIVQLRRAGCDIRIVYALMGNRVHSMLKANRVPILQYAYDRNRDGVYDIYVHMKVMAVSGVYAGRTNARVVVNGSANWSAVPLASDEVVGEFSGRGITNAYINWIDFMYNNRPRVWGPVNLAPVADTYVAGRAIRVDPYSFMKESGL